MISVFNSNVLSHRYSNSALAWEKESMLSLEYKEISHSTFFKRANLVMLDDPTIISTESSNSNK